MVLKNSVPEFASCPAGAIAEEDCVRHPDAGFNLNPALLKTLAGRCGAGRAQISPEEYINRMNKWAQWLFGFGRNGVDLLRTAREVPPRGFGC